MFLSDMIQKAIKEGNFKVLDKVIRQVGKAYSKEDLNDQRTYDRYLWEIEKAFRRAKTLEALDAGGSEPD